MASLVFLHVILSALAAPVSNNESSTSNDTDFGVGFRNNTDVPRNVYISSWMPTAKVRGTSDVLWSCVVTLTLCVYTAIHLNIPPAGEGHFAFWLRKTKWVMLAIFAPEIVIYTAFQQRLEARNTIRELNKLKNERSFSQTDTEKTVQTLLSALNYRVDVLNSFAGIAGCP